MMGAIWGDEWTVHSRSIHNYYALYFSSDEEEEEETEFDYDEDCGGMASDFDC